MPNVLNAKTLANVSEISHEQWLEWRKKGIGGSDAGAIMGLNPYSSAFQVYCDKKGLMPETEDNEASLRSWKRAKGKGWRLSRWQKQC
jgi:predicted phage-related endonuclease